MHKKKSFIVNFDRIKYNLSKGWYKFSRNPFSVFGLAIISLIIFISVLAPYITPYPEQIGAFTNFREASQPPSLTHFFGTDSMGRDIFTRIIFGYRFSLILVLVVLTLSVPLGVILGIIAGYRRYTWIETIIMRLTDIFLAVPALVLALAVAAMLSPNLFNQMMAVSFVWWTWYCRFIYSMTTSLCNEDFIKEAKLVGASEAHIVLKEILPNCVSAILTKMTLDASYVIIIGATLSFVGLGVQPPQSDLGTMVANGSRKLPVEWWSTIFPALAIVIVILAFNLVGDGLRDLFAGEEI